MCLSYLGAVKAETIRHTKTEITVYLQENALAVVAASTGAASLQTYLTTDECRELAALLVKAADELQPIPVPEVADSDFAAFNEAAK